MAPKHMEFPIIRVSQQYSPTLDYLVGEETEQYTSLLIQS